MKVPLPTGITGDNDIPKRKEYLVNLYSTEDTLIQTPGISALSTGDGICRGAVTFQNEYYQVSGSNLIRISSSGIKTVIGAIAGTADVVFAQSFIALCIVVKGGAGYFYSPSIGLVQITDPDYFPSVDVDSINARFVFVPADGGPLFYTDVNNLTDIPSLNFFDAELLPDDNKTVINLRNDLYIGGTDSFEVFRNQADVDTPFIRVNGAAIETGYVAAKARYKDTFLFLGRDRDGSFGFFAMSSGDAPQISNSAIAELLNEEYTEAELNLCTSQRFTWKGVDMVCFRLARHSLLYFGNDWTYMQTGIDPDDTLQPWSVNHLSFAYGKYLVGSADNNSIGILANINTEYGEKIERQINTFIKADRNAYFEIDSAMLDVTAGTNFTEGTVGLCGSKDGLNYGEPWWQPLGAQGRTEQQVRWTGGLGVFESFLGLKIRTTADVKFSVDGFLINV